MTTVEAITPDLGAVKQRQQQMWASGDFHAVAALIQPVAETSSRPSTCVPLARPRRRHRQRQRGDRRRPLRLRRRRHRLRPGPARARSPSGRGGGPDADALEGDAEAIPFPDASFDAVLSVFGSMFAPNHEQAAAEMARVCRPGGRIGLATWTPDGFIGEMLKVVSAPRAARRRAWPRRCSGARRRT